MVYKSISEEEKKKLLLLKEVLRDRVLNDMEMQMNISATCKKYGLNRSMMHRWKKGVTPSLSDLLDVIGSMGYEIKLEKV